MSCDLLISVLNLFMSFWLIRLYGICFSVVWRCRSLFSSAITVKWSDKPPDVKMEETIWLADRVMHRSNQWPWMWVEKLTCWRSPKDVKIYVNVFVWCDWMSKCKLKSPKITNYPGMKGWNDRKIRWIFYQSVKAYYLCTKKRSWYFAAYWPKTGILWNFARWYIKLTL